MARPRIVFWPHATDLAVASYRIRCAQVRAGLAAAGVPTGLWRRGGGPFAAAPDLLVLSKLTRPEALARALALKRDHGTRLVVDLCDNVFFGAEAPERRERARALATALDGFDAVVTPSLFLMEAVAAHLRPSMRFVVIPDAVEALPQPGLPRLALETRAFRALGAMEADLRAAGVAEGRRLIWFGISGTRRAQNGLADLEAFAPMLEAHDIEAPITLTVVTDSRPRYEEAFGRSPLRTRFLAWNFWTFNSCLAAHDIAVLPVRSNPYNLAKSANRMTTAFARGLAVAASAIPSYEPFRSVAVLDDFGAGLGRLMRSGAERRRRVEAAQAIIDADYRLASVVGKWRVLIAELLETTR